MEVFRSTDLPLPGLPKTTPPVPRRSIRYRGPSKAWVCMSHFRVAGKPVFIGKFGLHRDQGGGTTARDLLYEEIFEAFWTQSGAGALYWILYHDVYPDHDDYGVYYPADVSTINVIMDAAEALQDTLPPENVTDFSADTRHLTEGYMDLAWTEPDELVGVRIYRKEVGGYPLYDGGGTVPNWPASEDEAIADGWALIADLPYGSGAVADGPLNRDMYYYAAFVMGCNGLLAPGNPLRTGSSAQLPPGESRRGWERRVRGSEYVLDDLRHLRRPPGVPPGGGFRSER